MSCRVWTKRSSSDLIGFVSKPMVNCLQVQVAFCLGIAGQLAWLLRACIVDLRRPRNRDRGHPIEAQSESGRSRPALDYDMRPRFFATSAKWREWLERHHRTARELWVGFHKRGTGRPSMAWPESVDQALCFGWIDGVRKRLDETSYVIRFTPRRKGSVWSSVNLA